LLLYPLDYHLKLVQLLKANTAEGATYKIENEPRNLNPETLAILKANLSNYYINNSQNYPHHSTTDSP
jgi:hypothetical protein